MAMGMGIFGGFVSYEQIYLQTLPECGQPAIEAIDTWWNPRAGSVKSYAQI